MDAISEKEALELINIEDEKDIFELFARASAQRRRFFANKVSACSIINARCGGCQENCSFCAQSKSSKAKINYYSLLSADEIASASIKASSNGIERIGIVTSGRAIVPGNELDTICNSIKLIREKTRLLPCASLGVVSLETLAELKKSGLDRYHHNLETSASFFPKICSTRNYSDQINTVVSAKNAGLSVCSGGIFGLGENNSQRIELLSTLRDLNVDSVPVNFLIPIPGTKLENIKRISPMECLKIIALARLMLPDKTIRVCGGREVNLADFQSWIFAAGANGIMTGGYLVTPGREPSLDIKMIKDAGLSLWTY